MTELQKYPNPGETQEALRLYHSLLADLGDLSMRIDEVIPEEMIAERKKLETLLEESRKACRAAAELHGGYKDDQGWEARIEERVSVEYDVASFEADFPNLALLCVEKVVNKEKLNGLVRGGFLRKEDLEPLARKKSYKAFVLR